MVGLSFIESSLTTLGPWRSDIKGRRADLFTQRNTLWQPISQQHQQRHYRNQGTAQTIHQKHRNANKNDKRTKCSFQAANATNHSHTTTAYKHAKQKIKTDTLKIAAWNSNGLQHRALETKTFLYNNIDILLVLETLQKATWKYHTTLYMIPNSPQKKRTEGLQW